MSETQGTEKTGKRRGERDSKGRFLPGNTGAVAHGCGRPPVIRPIRELAKQYSEPAIMALVSIMQDDAAHGSARVAAAKEILDRGEGKVAQAVDATLSGALAIRWMSPDEAAQPIPDDND